MTRGPERHANGGGAGGHPPPTQCTQRSTPRIAAADRGPPPRSEPQRSSNAGYTKSRLIAVGPLAEKAGVKAQRWSACNLTPPERDIRK